MPIRPLAVLTAVVILTGCATPTQSRFDAEVDRLCAIDGGNHIFESVKLPRERFDKNGFPDFVAVADHKLTLGSDYVVRDESFELATSGPSGPSIHKHFVQVSRVADAKVLGQSVFYYRPGGDRAGLHFSGHSCDQAHPDILKQIFVPKD